MLEAARRDVRIKSCVSLDGSLHLLKKEGTFPYPLLSIRQDSAAYEEMKETMKDIIAKAYAEGQEYLNLNSTEESLFLKITGADHLSFSDIPLLFNQGENVSRETIYGAIAEVVEAFLAKKTKDYDLSQSNPKVKKINQYGSEISFEAIKGKAY